MNKFQVTPFSFMNGQSGYEKVGGSFSSDEKAERVEFKTPGQTFEGLLVRRILDHPGNGQFGPSDLFFFRTWPEGRLHLIGTSSKILCEKLREVRDGAKVLVQFVGVPAGKRYKKFEVFIDTTFNGVPNFTGAAPEGNAGITPGSQQAPGVPVQNAYAAQAPVQTAPPIAAPNQFGQVPVPQPQTAVPQQQNPFNTAPLPTMHPVQGPSNNPPVPGTLGESDDLPF